MSIFKYKEKKYVQFEWEIKRKCLDLIFECAKSNFPNEFGGLLRVDDEAKNVISELVQLFRKHGRVHIIAANPFNKSSWKAYDYNGKEIDMKVI